MQVLARVRQLYKIDDSRIYLMGHSMGAIGTWKIAPKYPNIWAAIAPISGSGAAATLEKIRSVPEIVVHGDADPTVPVTGSRTYATIPPHSMSDGTVSSASWRICSMSWRLVSA